MASAALVVHTPSRSGGRLMTANDCAGTILGLARSDRDVVEFLRQAGLEDAEGLLDAPAWVTWRGGCAHHYEAACLRQSAYSRAPCAAGR
ncbi:hypothetical protein [Streptomyces sp. SID14478]|uniref:hypothetical protein n=1 Tax=Streptomyces sp. SID14478 TaxID=2706073 RepID=UPI001EF39543|nr:hypothetical protein [Streptomyces sp. SID14478]